MNSILHRAPQYSRDSSRFIANWFPKRAWASSLFNPKRKANVSVWITQNRLESPPGWLGFRVGTEVRPGATLRGSTHSPMTAEEIRADILKFIRALEGRDPRELKAWFLLAQSFVGAAHEISAQLAELNVSLKPR
jgi:hypothetical protein